MSAYTIHSYISRRQIAISDYSGDNLLKASYTVSLGSYFFRHAASADDKILNPFNEDDVASYWGRPCDMGVIPAGSEAKTPTGVTLASGETIIGHTDEFIGTRAKVVVMMKERWPLLRSSIRVSGYGHPEKMCRWSLHITNNNKCSVTIPYKCKIAEVYFLYTDNRESKDYSLNISKARKAFLPTDILQVLTPLECATAGDAIARKEREVLRRIDRAHDAPSAAASTAKKAPLSHLDEIWDEKPASPG